MVTIIFLFCFGFEVPHFNLFQARQVIYFWPTFQPWGRFWKRKFLIVKFKAVYGRRGLGRVGWEERAGPMMSHLMVKAYSVEYVSKAWLSLWNSHFRVTMSSLHSGRSASFETKEHLPTLDLHLSDSSEQETSDCCHFLIRHETLRSPQAYWSSAVPFHLLIDWWSSCSPCRNRRHLHCLESVESEHQDLKE